MAIKTEFQKWLSWSLLAREDSLFRLLGWQIGAMTMASFGHFFNSCSNSSSFVNFLMSAGDFRFKRHSGSFEYSLISFLFSFIIPTRVQSFRFVSLRTALANAELFPQAAFVPMLLAGPLTLLCLTIRPEPR